MDHRGHPKKPLERKGLPLESLVEGFVSATEEEDPSLAKHIKSLKNIGRRLLAGILIRFNQRGGNELDAEARLLSRRVLIKLHRMNEESLDWTNKILDYLDLDQNAIISLDELELCVEIMELFAHADSDNETLSPFELEMLYMVLRYLDTNDNGKLDSNEKDKLRQGLDDWDVFITDQKARNPHLRKMFRNRADY
jgi:hypothetical protein